MPGLRVQETPTDRSSKNDRPPLQDAVPATYGDILSQVRDGIIVQDVHGRVEWINPACETMFGWSLEDVRGRRPLEFLTPPDTRPTPEEIAAFRYDLNSSVFDRFRVDEHIRRDGSRLWNQQSFAKIDKGLGEEHVKVVITCRDVTDQVRTEQALRHMQADLQQAAHHDDLTGLANRKRLTEFLKSDTVRARIARRDVGVLQIDVDKFKEINDTLGHAAGDATLVHIAHALRDQSAPGDLVCRTGGDEFLLICPGISTREALMRRAARLRKAIGEPFVWSGQSIRVDISAGACLPHAADTSGEALIQMADQALYSAKEGGRGQVVLYTECLGRKHMRQAQLTRDLHTAISAQQFEIYLQPQLLLPANRITGCEALLRWNHPEHGTLAPGEFLDAAERNGLLAEIDYISMNLALDALVRLRQAWKHDFCLSINVSGSILADVNYPGLLDWALQSRGIEPGGICIEILETTILVDDGVDVAAAVDRLKRLGVRVALDDFGTGYAGLSHLSAFDIDAIKIDRSMTCRLETDQRSRIITRSIIRLCSMLGMKVVAEGVETQGQLDILRRAKCPLVQGFGLAHPMPVHDTIEWLGNAADKSLIEEIGSCNGSTTATLKTLR